MTVSELQTSIDEIYSFFEDPKTEVRSMAVKLLAGLTVDHANAMEIFSENPQKYLVSLLQKLSDEPTIAALAWDAVVNMAAEAPLALFLIDNYLDRIMGCVKSKELIFADAATKVLANMTKQAESRPQVMAPLLSTLFPIYMAGSRHNKNCSYEFLACCLADLTNLKEGRLFFLENNMKKLGEIMPDLHAPSVIRRGAVASIIKNCLFEVDYHEVILEKEDSDDFIITTLAGRLLDSKSDLSADEKEKLPIELQLLDKVQAESDLVVRFLIVESLIVLATTRRGRDTIRRKEIYPILREWHLLESDSDMKALVEKIVELLIRDEEEAS